MDAKELTKVVNDHSDKIIKLEKSNKYLEDELSKLRLLIKDLQIDVQMAAQEREVRHGWTTHRTDKP